VGINHPEADGRGMNKVKRSRVEVLFSYALEREWQYERIWEQQFLDVRTRAGSLH
jgi:hypothetical protein